MKKIIIFSLLFIMSLGLCFTEVDLYRTNESTVLGLSKADYITLIAPNGGELLESGYIYGSNIKWTTSSVKGSVHLFYSINGGVNWIHINCVPVTNTSGTYNWTIPSGINTTQAKIKVDWLGGCSGPVVIYSSDTSDSNFTIKPAIKLIAPNGGEIWETGGTYQIKWQTASTGGGISIAYSIDAGVNWVNINCVSNTSTSGTYNWTIPAGIETTRARIRVNKISNCTGISTLLGSDTSDNNFTIRTAGVAPTAPSGLRATVVSCNVIDLTWTDDSDNEDGFKIERKEGLGSYSEIATVMSNTTTFTDSSVSAEKTYSYRIRAYNSFGNSSYSSELVISTPPCGPVPNAPTNLTATLISVSEAKLKWTDNSDNEQNFILERKAEGGTYAVVGTIVSNTVETTSTGLLPDTKYYFRIRARNEYGYSNYSNETSVTTPSETATPDAPTGLTATATSCNSVTLTWTDNAINETNFVVERKLEGESYTVIEGTTPANTNSYADNTVEEGKKYYYKVKASNANGDSGYSNEVSLTTPPCGFPPNAPSNLTATTLSETEIQLNFTDNSDNENGFKLERKEPGGTYELIAVLPSNTTSHKDTGLTPNTTYYYRVCAYNSYGASSYSNEANAITKKELAIPAKPTNLFASASSSTEIRLSWTDASDNEDGFKIERKTSGGSFTEIKILTADSTTYTDTGLTPDTTYYYRIRAYNAAGYSDYSNEASATTEKGVESIIIRLYIDKTTYYVNDTLMTMDVAPIIRESRTLLPIRYVAEALGADVEWNATERKVTITFKETIIELWIDKNTAKVNGEYKLIDATNPKVTPIIIPPGRTMLPIRFIAENLGCLVEWSDQLREVKVTYPAT